MNRSYDSALTSKVIRGSDPLLDRVAWTRPAREAGSLTHGCPRCRATLLPGEPEDDDGEQQDEEAVHRVEGGHSRIVGAQADEDRLQDELPEHEGGEEHEPTTHASDESRNDEHERQEGERVASVAMRD